MTNEQSREEKKQEFVENFKSFLDAFSNNITKEKENEFLELVQLLAKKYDYLNLTNPEQFSLFSSRTMEEMKSIAFRLHNFNTFDKEVRHKAEFIFEQYKFVEYQLKGIFEPIESWSCTTDKSRFLINQYVKYLKGEEPTEFPEERSYMHPKVATISEWIAFIDSLVPLFYRGKTEEYAEKRNNLVRQYINYVEQKVKEKDSESE